MLTIDLSFDDGSSWDLRLAGILSDHDLTATFYIPSQWETYLLSRRIPPLTLNEINIIARDHEIGSHGVYHNLLTRVPLDEADYEIKASRLEWDIRGITTTKFCYPRGYYNQDIKDLVKAAGYESARTTRVGELRPASDPFETGTTVHVGIERKEYGTDWLTYALAKLDEAVERSAKEDIVYHAWGHGWEIEKFDQWNDFAVLCRRLDETAHR